MHRRIMNEDRPRLEFVTVHHVDSSAFQCLDGLFPRTEWHDLGFRIVGCREIDIGALANHADLAGVIAQGFVWRTAIREPGNDGTIIKQRMPKFEIRCREANADEAVVGLRQLAQGLSLIHISEPTRRTPISYAV